MFTNLDQCKDKKLFNMTYNLKRIEEIKLCLQ